VHLNRAHIALTGVPLWITEIVPPKDRGVLSDIHTIFINVGYITASYVGVGFYFYKDASGKEWRGPLAIGCLPCLLCLVWLWFVPGEYDHLSLVPGGSTDADRPKTESPRYLLMKQRPEKAWEIVKTLHTRDDDPHHTFATAEFYQMRKQLAFDRTLKSSYWEMFRRPSYRKRVFMACGLTFTLMSSGVLVINSR
jgi:MFS family permease